MRLPPQPSVVPQDARLKARSDRAEGLSDTGEQRLFAHRSSLTGSSWKVCTPIRLA